MERHSQNVRSIVFGSFEEAVSQPSEISVKTGAAVDPEPVTTTDAAESATASVVKPAEESKLWSEIVTSPPASSSASSKPIEKSSTPERTNTPKEVLEITPSSSTNSPPEITSKRPVKTLPEQIKEQALSLPESHYLSKTTRTNQLLHDIYDQNLSLSAAATKNNFASAEEAGIALAVFGLQAKRLLKARRVYKETMLLAFAKDKDGFSGADMGELYTEVWNQRKEDDKRKAGGGLKRNEGRERARQRDREMKKEGPFGKGLYGRAG